MRICIATRAPFVGGAEVAAERLAIGLRDAGHCVSVLCGQAGAVQERFRKAGLETVVIPLHTTDLRRFWLHAASVWRTWRFLRGSGIEVLHANDLPTHQMVARAARIARVPRVCHHRFPFDGPTIDWFNKYGAERHVFVSQALMEQMCAVSSRLADSPRAVVHDGLPREPMPTAEERTRLRGRLGLPPTKVVVLYAGQIIERKGVADLLHAWGQCASDNAELHLIGEDLQGQGVYRRTMEQLATTLGITARFHGFRDDVPDWLKTADLAVVPSHVEPLGNATLEAMAHGLPVIGTRVGGIPEMVVDEETGLLVNAHAPAELARALQRLIADATLRSRLGDNARVRCERAFSLTAHVQAMVREMEQARTHSGA